MKAVWLEDRTVALSHELAVPRPPTGEALVRIICAGICSTDHGLMRGMYPFTGIPGHEFVGRVEQGPDVLVGSRVVGVISASCRTCSTCRAGRASHCPSRTVLGIEHRNGVFAEFTTLPVANLHVVPDSLSSDLAVFTEPLAAALEVLEQVHIRPTDRVLLVGPGKLGQLIARVLHLMPCDLTVVGRSAAGLDRLPEAVRRAEPAGLPESSFDVVIECTGNAEGFAIARRGVRAAGTLVLKSTHGDQTQFDMTMAVVDEIKVVGSRCGPFPPAIAMLADGRVDPSGLIDHVLPLDDAVEALRVSQEPGVFKVLLDCGD